MTFDPDRPFFATAAAGTEGALRDELRELRLPRVRADRGGVHFGGELEHAIRACLRSRIASRVLYKLARFSAPDPDALYAGTSAVDWSHYLERSRTLAVFAHVKDSQLRHSNFVALRVKDAIVDQLRARTGERPDVNRNDPDVRLSVRLVRDEAELYVDCAGEPLHRRGYRVQAGEAPLKEHLAAAILRLAGWRPGVPLLDPTCGSGTFCIEAASWAAGISAGGQRRFGFERWRCYDDTARASFELERERAQRFSVAVETPVRGCDWDAQVLGTARANAQRASVRVGWEHENVFVSPPPRPGTFIVSNPPYAVRLSYQGDWLGQFGQAIRRMKGCRIAVITPDKELCSKVGVSPTLEHELRNGDLNCRLYVWKIG